MSELQLPDTCRDELRTEGWAEDELWEGAGANPPFMDTRVCRTSEGVSMTIEFRRVVTWGGGGTETGDCQGVPLRRCWCHGVTVLWTPVRACQGCP